MGELMESFVAFGTGSRDRLNLNKLITQNQLSTSLCGQA